MIVLCCVHEWRHPINVHLVVTHAIFDAKPKDCKVTNNGCSMYAIAPAAIFGMCNNRSVTEYSIDGFDAACPDSSKPSGLTVTISSNYIAVPAVTINFYIVSRQHHFVISR